MPSSVNGTCSSEASLNARGFDTGFPLPADETLPAMDDANEEPNDDVVERVAALVAVEPVRVIVESLVKRLTVDSFPIRLATVLRSDRSSNTASFVLRSLLGRSFRPPAPDEGEDRPSKVVRASGDEEASTSGV